VLFGATSPSQVEQNVEALALAGRLTADDIDELRALGRRPH
jgi:aryl-alcohol dehydrogenase-like predicted oxidoreductase